MIKSYLKIFLFFIFMFSGIIVFAQHSVNKNIAYSIALILKVNGTQDEITTVSTYKYSFFTGRIKNQYQRNSMMSTDVINVKISDENGKTLFDGFLENPLMKKLEAFNEDGTIEQLNSKTVEDYINVRFHLLPETKELNIRCYQVNAGNENKLISGFKLNIK